MKTRLPSGVLVTELIGGTGNAAFHRANAKAMIENTAKDKDFVGLLEAAIARYEDQSETGRRQAYDRLRYILNSQLDGPPPVSAASRRKAINLLEKLVVSVEYKVSATSAGRERARSKEEADAVIDQLAFLKSSDDLEFGLGPRYEVIDGKLSLSAKIAPAEEVSRQRNIHSRLKISCKRLGRLLAPASNQYPILTEVAYEYEQLLDPRTEELDVSAIWSVGDALSSLSQAYKRQDSRATLSTPLEPDLHGVLDSVVREHGAFVMGFAEARSLIERADQFAMNTAVLEHIRVPGTAILSELSANRELVNDSTLSVHKSILGSVNEAGWATGRAGFAAYLVVRNAISATIRTTIGSEMTLVGAATLTSILADAYGIPHRDFLINGASVIRAQSQNILAFFAHSREFLDYVTWAINIIERDDELRRRRDI